MNIHRYLMAGLAVATLLTAPVMAQTSPSGGPLPVVQNPDWLRRPTGPELMEYFPRAALLAGKSGEATLSCTAAITGMLHNCVVVSETPRGLGYGAAAVGLSSKFQMRPMMIDGVATEVQLRVPVRFSCNGCPGSTPPTGTRIQPRVDGGRSVYLEGLWSKAPTFEEWKASYPPSAGGVSGGATFECAIRPDGALASCSSKNELPAKLGFANAARKLLPLFQADLEFAAVKPGAFVLVTITYPAAQLEKTRASTSPAYAHLVSQADADAAFPAVAREEKIPFGRAVLQCALTDDGAPGGCAVRSETPAGKGFGAAALSVGPKLRFNMWSKDGLPVSRTIAIPLAFGVPPRGEEDLSTLVERAETLIEAGKLQEAAVEVAELRRRFAQAPAAQRLMKIMQSAFLSSGNLDGDKLNSSCWKKAEAGKDLASALEDCNRALKMVPNQMGYLDSRALVYLRSGDQIRAIADYNAALATYPDYAHAIFGRGVAKRLSGDIAGGQADIITALALDPNIEGTFAGYGVKVR